MMITIIVILALLVILAGIAFYSKLKTQSVELEIEMIPGDIDNVFENFHVGKNVNVVGLIGTDFLDKYGYIIDFKRNRIWHNLHSISFKEAMELLRVPYIVLWQNNSKYIFIVDSGSGQSHISSKVLNTLDFDLDMSKQSSTLGAGGITQSQGIVTAKFYYR